MNKEMPQHLIAGLLVLLGTVACKTSQVQDTEATELASPLGKGVQCFLVPDEQYRPGTVFRINEHGTTYIANRKLAEQIDVTEVDASMGRVKGSQHFNLGLLATLLDLKNGGQNLAQVNVSADRTRTLDAQLSGLKHELTDDDDVDVILKWFGAYSGKREKSRYFVVREAYSASAMELNITKELKAELGGEATFDQAVKANPKLLYDPSASYNLTASFPSRLRVCIKSERLTLVKAGITGSIYKTEPVEAPLSVTASGGDDS